jgi:hypothetical protein
MSDYVEEAFEWLESNMNKQIAVIETRIVGALLQHIEEARQDELSGNSGQLLHETEEASDGGE